MKKITITLITLVFFLNVVIAFEHDSLQPPAEQQIDYANPRLDLSDQRFDLNLVDWSTRSQAEVPPSRISELRPEILKIEEISDKTKITSNQWEYGDNLNKAEDLSLYSNARQAVNQKHPGFSLALAGGHVSYIDGKIKNGNAPPIDLNNQDLKGAGIMSLPDGGFLIERGFSEGKFTVGDIKFDLSLEEGTSAEVKEDQRIVLSKGAHMTDSSGTEVVALNDETNILAENAQLTVSGNALVRDRFGNFEHVGDVEAETKGEFSLEYGSGGYSLDKASALVRKGKLKFPDGTSITSEIMALADKDSIENLGFTLTKALESTLTKVCNGEECQYYAKDVSTQDLIYAIAQQRGFDLPLVEEQLGISTEFAVALGTGALAAAQYLPTETTFETENGEFSATLGLDKSTLRPFLIGRFRDNVLRVEQEGLGGISELTVPLGEGHIAFGVFVDSVPNPETDSLSVDVNNLNVRLDLGDQGSIEIESQPDLESGYVSASYRRSLGENIIASLRVQKSSDIEEVLVDFDLNKIFE